MTGWGCMYSPPRDRKSVSEGTGHVVTEAEARREGKGPAQECGLRTLGKQERLLQEDRGCLHTAFSGPRSREDQWVVEATKQLPATIVLQQEQGTSRAGSLGWGRLTARRRGRKCGSKARGRAASARGVGEEPPGREGRPAEANARVFPEQTGPQGCSQGQGEGFGSGSEGVGAAGRLWAEAPSGWEWAEPAKGEVSRRWVWGDLGRPGQVLSWGLSRELSCGVRSLGGIPSVGPGSPWGVGGQGRAQHCLLLPCGAGTIRAPETQAREHGPAQPSAGSALRTLRTQPLHKSHVQVPQSRGLKRGPHDPRTPGSHPLAEGLGKTPP